MVPLLFGNNETNPIYSPSVKKSERDIPPHPIFRRPLHLGRLKFDVKTNNYGSLLPSGSGHIPERRAGCSDGRKSKYVSLRE